MATTTDFSSHLRCASHDSPRGHSVELYDNEDVFVRGLVSLIEEALAEGGCRGDRTLAAPAPYRLSSTFVNDSRCGGSASSPASRAARARSSH